MDDQINWNQIKQTLKESFIMRDFQSHSTTAFSGVDFDNGLEIFRYILQQKLPNHDETLPVFNALSLYTKLQDKNILEKLVSKYEPFTKKLFEIIQVQHIPNQSNPKAPALGWCYNKLFTKLSIEQRPYKDEFYKTTITDKIEVPGFQSSYFSTNFLTDGTEFGKALHSSYHFRNSNIHNDPSISSRNIPEYITDYINSYLYFTFKYYNELVAVIPPDELTPVQILTIRNLASLTGGAYNPTIDNEVKRDNIIQTIEKKLKSLDVLFIEGEEGIGKTTILHQFVAKYPHNCFAYFIDDKDSYSYSNLIILQSFCNQLYFEIKQDKFEYMFEKEFYDEDFLKKYFSSNSHHLTDNKKSSQTFYFVIDGLDKISRDKQNEIKEQILDKIPYDKHNVKLILTGKPNKSLLKSNCIHDKLEMIVLSKEDSCKIFGIEISSEQFDDINKISQNNAGKIVFFRDLKKRIGLENIIDKLSSDMKAIYQNLWSDCIDRNNNYNNTYNLFLALLAFHDKKYNAEDIAKLLGFNEDEVLDIIRSIPFIRKNSRGTYEYIFDGFSNFAKTKLSNYKNNIDKIVIDHLLRDLDSDSNSVYSLVRLLEIYEKTGKKDDSIKLLTDERWKQLLVSSEKISVVSRVSNVALETIQYENENKYIPTLLKYSVLKSALKELSRTTVWQYEIAASLVLGDYMVAENLANIAFLKEDRLKMFASIARAYTERKEKVPNNIQRKIQELYNDIDVSKDFKNIKESAVDIASLLMYSNPKLSFRLIEDLSGIITDNDNAFDWALAQISLSVSSNLENLEDVSKEDINTKVYSKIRNPKIKEFADAILYLSENQTCEQIIEKISQIESTSQKMFLIRNWIGNNKKDKNIAKIIELGLKLVVNKSDKYVPKSSDYKIFATPLPHIKDESKAYDLIEKIEQYTASIESNSATNDLLAIKLFIARTLCNFDFEKGEEKLLDIYTEIEKLSNNQQKATKCNCLAIYANEATEITNTHQDRNLDVYLDAAREGIKNNIDEILEQTASHFEIVQSIITNLARLYPTDAIEICQKLNKSIDRDNAYLETLASYLQQALEKIDTKIIDKLLNSIIDLDIQKIAISEIINRLEVVENNEKELVPQFYIYFNKVDNLFDNRAKCLLYVNIISILEGNEQDFSIIYGKLIQTWEELEKSVYKIELGFEIAYHAAFLRNKDIAKNILRAAKDEKDQPDLLLDSPNTAEVLNLTIELAIRVFTGLVYRNNYEEKDIDNIEKIISSLPSEKQQISLWSSLILRIIPKSKDENFPNYLIEAYIIPKLAKIKNKNERIIAILDTIIVLYFNNKNIPNLEELPNQKLKDIALSRICKFLFTKSLPDDVCDDNGEGYIIDHQTVEKILELINMMGNDYFIASQIKDIRNSIFSKNTTISNQKKIDIKNKFEEIAASKLPDGNNIKHLGYQLLVKANAIAIQSRQKWEEWDCILQEVENIPNLSDRIYMWNSIAELLSDDFTKYKQRLIHDAINSAYKLPSFLDTVERIQMILFMLNRKSIAGVGLKPLLENFVKVINDNPYSPSLRENYKKILDVAHSTDPTIAKTLVSIIDNDPARQNTGAYLNNHYNFLEFQSKLEKKLDPKENEQILLESNPKFFQKIIEKKLSRLNASKIDSDGLYPKNVLGNFNQLIFSILMPFRRFAIVPVCQTGLVSFVIFHTFFGISSRSTNVEIIIWRMADFAKFNFPTRSKDLAYQLKIASQHSIYESHYIFSYFIEKLVRQYEDTNEAKKLIRNSFLELLEVCNLIKLLSIRNADKIKNLLDVSSIDNGVNNPENYSNITDDDIITINTLFKKGKSPQEISSLLEIDIEIVKSFDTYL